MRAPVVEEPRLVIDLRDPPAPEPPETRRDPRRSVVLLVALNVLNVLDAILTHAVTHAGVAVEVNPVVGWLTLPGKVALVAALSLVLWRLRPSALVVPVAGYSLVVCYTIAGARWAA
jgi:hypothetical protein